MESYTPASVPAMKEVAIEHTHLNPYQHLPQETNLVMTNIQNAQNMQHRCGELHFQAQAIKYEPFLEPSEVTTSTCISETQVNIENPKSAYSQSSKQLYDTKVISDPQLMSEVSYRGTVTQDRSGYPASSTRDIDIMPIGCYETESETFHPHNIMGQSQLKITDCHTASCQTLSKSDRVLANVKCPDNNTRESQLYSCGACCQTFSTICMLHDHLLGHLETGSYYYNHILRIAFPKFDGTCASTQTDCVLATDKCSLSTCNTFIVDNELIEETSSQKIYANDDNNIAENNLESHTSNSDVSSGVENQFDQDYTCNSDSKSIENKTIDQETDTMKTDDYSGKVNVRQKTQTDGGNGFGKRASVILCSGKGNKVKKEKTSATEKMRRTAVINSVVDYTETNKVFNSESVSSDSNGASTEDQETVNDVSLRKCTKAKGERGTNHHRKGKQATLLNIKPSDKPLFMCSFCPETFRYSKGLNRHERTCHPQYLRFECDICHELFVKQNDVDSHKLLSHTCSKKQKLKRSRSSRTITDIKLQINESRHDSDNSGSKLTLKLTKKPMLKAEKKAIESDEQVSLTQVGVSDDQEVKSKDKLIKSNEINKLVKSNKQNQSKKGKSKRHVIKSENTEIFQCDFCEVKLRTQRKAEIHRRIHTGERPCICEVCGKGLISETRLTRHMVIHSDMRPYSCGLCSATFKDSYKLRRHQIIHSGERSYLCSVCGADFTQSASLVQHIKGVHLQLKPFKCDLCGARFSAKRARDDHLMSHTDERTNTCKYCGKQLKYLQGLRRHEKSHIEQKKYNCDICSSSFQRKDNLIRHKQSHMKLAGECKVCGKRFHDIKSYKEHMKVHLHFGSGDPNTAPFKQVNGESSQLVIDETSTFNQAAAHASNGDKQGSYLDARLMVKVPDHRAFIGTDIRTSQLTESDTVRLFPMAKIPTMNPCEILPTHLPSQISEFSTLQSLSGLDSRPSHLIDTLSMCVHVCCDQAFPDLRLLHDHIQNVHRVDNGASHDHIQHTHRVDDNALQPKQETGDTIHYNIHNL